ncbi:hypothetical protein K7432_016256 [Basidiobolus ranarum]|uniref:Carrier domain-containing protein n=1 Tax=Basidiobolus ranarum TaxID=34480 RepID=A0ABR2VMN4_9FUNG
MSDLDAIYNGTLRPSVIPYKDYIAYRIDEEKALSDDMGSEYWTSYLSGTEPCAFPRLGDLNLAKPEHLQLAAKPRIATKDLRHFAKDVGVTLATLVQAAWGLLLQPYYAQEDFVYGILTNGRNMPMKNIDKVIGPCINTSPLRIQYDKEARVVDWLHKIHLHLLTSIPFQNRGLQKINQWCKASGNAIEFDAILNFQSQDENDVAGDSPRQLSFELEKILEPTEYKLTLNSWTENGTLVFRLDFNSDAITHSLAQHLLERLEVILEAIIKSNGETKIQELPKMAEPEKSLIDSFNVNKSNTSEIHDCLHHLLEKQAAITPNNVVVQYENTEYVTYEEFNRRANKLAHLLIKHGVKPDSMIPLCMDKSVDQLVAIMAVLKAGAAYVPLDPNTPVERNRFIVHETKATVVVTLEYYKHYFENRNVILVDSDKEIISQQSVLNPVVDGLTPSNLCYILFTSGSTGAPKGVMLEHSAVVSFATAQQAVWNLTEQDVVLQFSNYNFDLSVMEIYVPFLSGARIAVASKERLLTDLEGCISTMGVTSMILTPTVASFINPENVPSVKRVQTAGEMLTSTVRNTWVPYADFYNSYGPTETAVVCSVNPKINERASIANVGKSMGNTNMYVLDPELSLVPIGVIGEVCVSGSQMGRGYFNRPDLTEAAWVKNPFIPGELMYRSGDLGRFNTDGTLEMVGRMDNQIKLNGLRIELDEIEHALYEHSMTDRACVLPLVADPNTNRRVLVAFVTYSDMLDNDAKVDLLNGTAAEVAATYIDETRNLSKQILPSYMVPTVWLPLQKMPTNANGKVDRKSLTAFFKTLNLDNLKGLSLNVPKAECSSPIEITLQEIWSATLNIAPSQIGANDSFFHLGGDSISAIRMSSLSRQKGISFTVQQVMQNPTIREQASVSTVLTVISKATEEPREGAVPLTPIQEYFFETTQKNANHFNQSWLLRLQTHTNVDNLSNAINEIIDQHDMLRSRFTNANGEWKLQVLPPGKGPCTSTAEKP